MKLIVDEIPDKVENCPFFSYDSDWCVGRCTLSGNIDTPCYKYNEDECESCVTFSRYLKGER